MPLYFGRWGFFLLRRRLLSWCGCCCGVDRVIQDLVVSGYGWWLLLVVHSVILCMRRHPLVARKIFST